MLLFFRRTVNEWKKNSPRMQRTSGKIVQL
jgi:hypothetical protein